MADATGSQMVALTDIEVEGSPGASVVVVSGLIPAIALIGVFAIVPLILGTRLRRGEPEALEILRRRLARGEVSPEQYRNIRALLAEVEVRATGSADQPAGRQDAEAGAAAAEGAAVAAAGRTRRGRRRADPEPAA